MGKLTDRAWRVNSSSVSIAVLYLRRVHGQSATPINHIYMSLTLSVDRLPLDPGVDLLSGRRTFDYIEFERTELYGPAFAIYASESDPFAGPNPRCLWFGNAYPLVFEVLTGVNRGQWSGDRFRSTPDDPRAYSLYGARKAGWEQDRDFPWGYSMRSDIAAIREALAQMSDDDLWDNFQAAQAEDPMLNADGTRFDFTDTFERYYQGRLLPAMTEFYENAEAEDEIVVYNFG